MSVIVVGSIAYDSVETNKKKVDNALGGAALFFANSASFFTDVNLVGVVGTDFDLEQINYLNKRNVNLDGVEVVEGRTFRWGGRYHQNMNQRDTLFTELNVFADFQPKIPAHFKDSEYVFLANIQPELQLDVLKQMNKPKCVIMDTMNFWISGERDSLLKLLKHVDILIINDEETKELAEDENLFSAAQTVLKMGPKTLIIKKGEHGAILIHENRLFMSPAFPLYDVQDPTGAGDTFAGGFVGYLAKTDDLSEANLRKAIIYGSTLASFVCEDFSFNRLLNLKADEIEKRYSFFREMTQF
ncbi:MAG: bifunctional hydroxymethylpyrimidine kinase/phosphomethylpyrimidine kinase [Calditrichaeota bacterium]|nr:bifunctional hydroxymethylpyrimidine kinase/phosphomethylpyrimidine kinase [Calditrichota bacterium]